MIFLGRILTSKNPLKGIPIRDRIWRKTKVPRCCSSFKGVGKFCKLHPHILQPLTLLLPNRNFASGHLLTSSRLDQIWAASFQKIEVNHAKEVLGLKVIWLSRQVVDLVGWVVDLRLRLP